MSVTAKKRKEINVSHRKASLCDLQPLSVIFTKTLWRTSVFYIFCNTYKCYICKLHLWWKMRQLCRFTFFRWFKILAAAWGGSFFFCRVLSHEVRELGLGRGIGRHRLLRLREALRIFKFPPFSLRLLTFDSGFPFQSLTWSQPRAGSPHTSTELSRSMPFLVQASHSTSGLGTK